MMDHASGIDSATNCQYLNKTNDCNTSDAKDKVYSTPTATTSTKNIKLIIDLKEYNWIQPGTCQRRKFLGNWMYPTQTTHRFEGFF